MRSENGCIADGTVTRCREYLLLIASKRFFGDQLAAFIRALDFAIAAHTGQKRKSGEAFVLHPMRVTTYLLANCEVDLPTAIAALLHDSVEDTAVTLKEIERIFEFDNILAVRVPRLVDGVTKERGDRAGTIAKLQDAADVDTAIWTIKGADRIDNLRSIDAIEDPRKRISIARETIEFYIPALQRRGHICMARELKELATGVSIRVLDEALFSMISEEEEEEPWRNYGWLAGEDDDPLPEA